MRQRRQVPWRVYRPAIVVGNSQDRRDGQDRRPLLLLQGDPEGPPRAAGVVPARRARGRQDEHRARSTTSPRRWTTSPTSPASTARPSTSSTRRCRRPATSMNTFARAGHAPQMAMRIDKRMTDMLPKGVLSYAMKLPALKDIRRSLLADLGIPDSVIEYIGADRDVRRPRHAARARGLGHRAPAAASPTPTSCGTTGSATSTPTCSRTARSRAPSTARR